MLPGYPVETVHGVTSYPDFVRLRPTASDSPDCVHSEELGFMKEALATFLVRRRWLLMVIGLGLALLAIPLAARLQLDRSIESLYASDNPLLLDYHVSKSTFGGDEFVIVAWKQPGLLRKSDGALSQQAAETIRALSNRLSRVGGINRVSTQDLSRVIDDAVRFAQDTAREGFGDNRVLSALARRTALHRQSDAIEFSRGILIGEDNQTTAIVLRLLPEAESPISRDETFKRIRAIAGENRYPTFVAGEPIQVHDAFYYVEEDGRILFRFSLALLGVVLMILFRSLRWVALPLLVTITAVLATRAMLAMIGAELSMVSSMLNSVVTIVAVATVSHVAVRYRSLRHELERVEALRETFRQLLVPIFWTSATTAAGFLALTSSDVVPVRSFGLMMALGTALVFLAVLLLVPQGAILLARKHEAAPLGPRKPTRLSRGLESLTDFALRHRVAILGLAIALLGVAAYGMSRMHVETDFSKNFRADSPIVLSLDFVENNLGGAGTWEVNFPAPPSLTNEHLAKVRDLAQRLRELSIDGKPAITKVVAIPDGLDMLPSGMTSEDPNENLKTIAQLQPEFAETLYNPGEERMRIVLRSEERQPSDRKRRIIESTQTLSREVFPEARTTGLFVLLTYLIDSLLRDQLVSFSLAGSALLGMIWIAFGRIWFAIVALLPNVLPILVLLGAMGLLGIPINIGTAMIASVSIGLTIDSSVHYFASYTRAREAGASVIEALRDTGRNVGVAIVFATLALSVGFSVLSISHFVPLIYFGLLVSLAMLGGLLGNLLLLPGLIPWGEPREAGLDQVGPPAGQPVPPPTEAPA